MFAQTDTAFWFTVPYLCSHSHGATYQLLLYAHNGTANVTVEMPSDSNFITKTFTIADGAFYDYELTNSYDSAQINFAASPDTISNHGIHVYSDVPISCYLQLTGENGELYSPKGRNGLGTDFVVTMQNSYPNVSSYPDAFSSIQIVATEDNTTITIYPTAAGGPSGTTDPVTIVLDRGQTYDFRAISQTGAGHLGGTRIVADKPIVVQSTDDSVLQGGFDLAGDQIVPVDFWGYEYVAVSMHNTWEGLYVTTLTDNTVVTLGDGSSFTINSGEVHYIPMGSVGAMYMSATEPIGVWQQTGNSNGGTGEVGGTMLPQMQCTGSEVVAYKRTTGTISTHLNIIAQAGNIGDFTINGAPLSSSVFSPVPGSDNTWYYANVDITNIVPENQLVIVRCTSGLFHVGAVDFTTGTSCTLGYFSDYAQKTGVVSTDSVMCFTDQIEWRGRIIRAEDIVTEAGGTVTISDTIALTLCNDSIYNLKLTVSPKTVEIAQDSTINLCEGDVFIFGKQRPQYITESGEYFDTIRNIIGCDDTIFTVSLHVNKIPILYSEEWDTICSGQSYSWHGRTYDASGDFLDTLAQMGNGCDSIVTLHLFVNPIATTTDTVIHHYMCEGDCYDWNGQQLCSPGTYSQKFINQYGCDSTVYLSLEMIRTPYQHSFADVSEFWDDPYAYIEQWKQQSAEPDFWNDPFPDFRQEITQDPDFWDDPYWNQLYKKDTVCDNEPAVIGGAIHKESGQYVDTLKDMYGCDSLVYLDLIVLKHSDTLFIDSICPGDTIMWQGMICDTVGLYIDTLENIVGCDSILTLEVRAKSYCPCDTMRDTMDVTLLYDTLLQKGYRWFDSLYYEPGVYIDTIRTVKDCDSIGTLILRTYYADDTTICRPDSAIFSTPWGDIGVPHDSTCIDTILLKQDTIDLVFAHLCVTREDCACDTARTHVYANIKEKELPSFEWNGYTLPVKPQNERQDTAFVFQTVKADLSCDSIATLHLHVLFDCELPTQTLPVKWRKEE